MYDIAIIGGGPAGATIARLLGSDFKMIVLDKRSLHKDFDANKRKKSCGGLLAPDAQKIMGELGLTLPKNILVDPQLFAVRSIDLNNNLERYYQRFYINLDREKFDRFLISLIPKGVKIATDCFVTSIKRTGKKAGITFVNKNRTYTEKAGIIIGADGANSIVRKLISKHGNYHFPERYVCIQLRVETDEILPYFSVIFDKEITDFYSWTIPKENYLLIGSAMNERFNLRKRFFLLKEKLINYGFRFKKEIGMEGSTILRTVRLNQICTGIENIALTGEAAGFISPSSAEGISYAFRSAYHLAYAIKNNPDSFLKDYKRQTLDLKSNIFLKNLKSPFMYNSVLRKFIMLSGINSLDIKKEYANEED